MSKNIFNKTLHTINTFVFFNIIALVVLLSIFTIFTSKAQNSQSPAQKIKLGIRKIDPFVTKDTSGAYGGFSIDLWNKLAENSNLETIEKKEYPNVTELLKAVENNEVDAGIAAISITADREDKVDFTTPMYNSGLSIMVRTDNTQSLPTAIFKQIKDAVFNFDFLIVSLWLCLFSFIISNIVYFLERRKIDGFLDDRNYFNGVTTSFWWCITGIFGQQESQPATKSGRFIGVLWMIFGVLFLSFYTAQITSNLTAQKITGDISSIQDLFGKKVATIKGSTASKYLSANNYSFEEKANVDEAGQALLNKEVEAVVYDSPALEYFINSKAQGRLQTVGGQFTNENYGIALPAKSELRKTLNLELLKLQESGEYQTIKEKYFGKEK
jgi:polar amino acid transport system substrate-binding protein